MNIYSINGYWKDNKSPFYGYQVTDTDDTLPEELDQDIFFYGLSEKDLQEAVEQGEDTSLQFVITSFEFLKSIKVCYAKGTIDDLFEKADEAYESKREND